MVSSADPKTGEVSMVFLVSNAHTNTFPRYYRGVPATCPIRKEY
jgi:hypothetical protein